MKKTLKSAIVGGGFIGKQHYEAIRRLPNTEVIAIVETSQEKADHFAVTYGIKYAFDKIEDLFELEELDVIHICTPNAQHYPMSKMALEHNVHVFCEKPMTLDVNESQDLIEIAKKSSSLHGVNLNYRSNVMVREMRERILNKDVGDVLLIHANYIQDWLMFDSDYDWHFEPAKVGPSRTIADIGSHVFDTIQFITGQKIVEVYAELITVYPQRKKYEVSGETFSHVNTGDYEMVDVHNEDAAMIIAKLESGVNVSINLSQVSGGYKNGFKVIVSGSKNSLTWDQERADRLIVGKRNEGNEELYADPKYVSSNLRSFIALPNGHAVGWADAMKNSIHEFYNAIVNQEANDSYVDFYDGHYLMKIVNAALESHQEKRWVKV